MVSGGGGGGKCKTGCCGAACDSGADMTARCPNGRSGEETGGVGGDGRGDTIAAAGDNVVAFV